MRFIILTGMSGAGKSTALKMMEDFGYYCVDNLPIPLIRTFAELSDTNEEPQKVALGVDIRGRVGFKEIEQTFRFLKEKKINYEILYLDADDSTLVKRFKETRRAHPLALQERVDKGILKEREQLSYLKKSANYIIDTSKLRCLFICSYEMYTFAEFCFSHNKGNNNDHKDEYDKRHWDSCNCHVCKRAVYSRHAAYSTSLGGYDRDTHV